MSTPFCMSFVTICDCEEPALCSLTINFITWSSVIDDCAITAIGNITDKITAMIYLFIFLYVFCLCRF